MSRVRQLLRDADQLHVLQFWSELSADQRRALVRELLPLEPGGLKAHCEAACRAAAAPAPGAQRSLEPVPMETFGSVRRSDPELLSSWENQGWLQVSQSRVGVLLLAGGQGTRLGVDYPKGMYDVGLPSGKTLYQLQAERILKVQQLADSRHGTKCSVPWYIMTSEFTLSRTQSFFEQNQHFGLNPSNVVMFEQRMIPSVSFDGKILLQEKWKIATAPDGNGGLYAALEDNNVLEDMRSRGVEYLQVYCVDNILVKMADPLFIGFCLSKGADCGAKVVEKAYPSEPVGVVCRMGGVSQVVEYSEIGAETAELRGPEGELMFNAGNICIHFFTRNFLQEVAQKFKDELKPHVALKKIPFIDECGNKVTPSKANGIKMEKFVFDVFPFSRTFVVLEVPREEEFSPLKNAEGSKADNPSTVRNSLLTQHTRWAMSAGARLLNQYGNSVTTHTSDAAQVEISPLVSYSGEGLEELLRGRTLTTPLLLDQRKATELQSQHHH
uniref:UDP-N-acetylhexosamine pyrophosphorylase-like protein 1 n=1 Tax=Gouania willdenowi TaxID=441366 RepID=A0A8C5GPK9_GOUWI